MSNIEWTDAGCLPACGWGWHYVGGERRLFHTGGQCRGPLHWVIVGGESGPGARPCDVAWIRSVGEQCRAAGVPCFVKQLGARPRWASSYDLPDDVVTALDANGRSVDEIHRAAVEGLVHVGGRKGGDMAEWPADLRVREFPAVAR